MSYKSSAVGASDAGERYPMSMSYESEAMLVDGQGPNEPGCVDMLKMNFAMIQKGFEDFARQHPTQAAITMIALAILGVGILVSKVIIAVAALTVAGLLAYASCCQGGDGVANGVKAYDRTIMRDLNFNAPQWLRTQAEARAAAEREAARASDVVSEEAPRSGRRSAPQTPSSAAARTRGERSDSRPATLNLMSGNLGNARSSLLDAEHALLDAERA